MTFVQKMNQQYFESMEDNNIINYNEDADEMPDIFSSNNIIQINDPMDENIDIMQRTKVFIPSVTTTESYTITPYSTNSGDMVDISLNNSTNTSEDKIPNDNYAKLLDNIIVSHKTIYDTIFGLLCCGRSKPVK